MRWTVGVGSVALVVALGCTGGGGGTAVTLNLGPRMERLDRCSQGDVVGCAELAYDYETGKDGPVDLTAARKMYRKACDGHVPEACGRLGTMIETGSGGDADPSAALPLYLLACDGDYSFGCANAALILQGEQSPDWPRVHALAERGCDGGAGTGCALLAVSYATGRDRVEDQSMAVEYLRRGCDHGHATSCTAAADAYERGVGVDRSAGTASELRKRGCALGDPAACP